LGVKAASKINTPFYNQGTLQKISNREKGIKMYAKQKINKQPTWLFI
jgi:hypothetical protein